MGKDEFGCRYFARGSHGVVMQSIWASVIQARRFPGAWRGVLDVGSGVHRQEAARFATSCAVERGDDARVLLSRK